MSLLRLTTAILVASATLTGASLAFDSMGGFDRPYTNQGNAFGKGAWGNGQGTAIPLPRRGESYGFRYEQPYEPTNNLFGTGFWAAEYAVRAGGDQGRTHGRVDEGGGKRHDEWSDLPMAELSGKDKDHGKDKDDHCKKGSCHPDKPGKPDKPGHGKPHKPDHGKPPEVVYVPYPVPRTEYVYMRRRTTVVVEQPPVSDIGTITLTEREAPTSDLTITAVCIDGKGNELDAYVVVGADGDPNYEGEIYRCPAHSMLRVSYESGTEDLDDAVDTADGTSYLDCDEEEAFVREHNGRLMCAPQSPMSAREERQLARQAYGDEQTVARSEEDDRGAPDIVDVSGMQLTGGVGGM